MKAGIQPIVLYVIIMQASDIPTFVALLRGIHVGKAKRMPMEALLALLGEPGYANVVTLLNSGKVGKVATTRNWSTVLKLQALLNEGAAQPN